MAIELEFDLDRGIAIARVIGAIVMIEIDELLGKASTPVNTPKSNGTLWDLRECDFASFNREKQNELLKVRKKYPNRSKMKMAALVADDLGYAIMRRYQSLAHVSGIADQSLSLVTKSIDEAYSWLEN